MVEPKIVRIGNSLGVRLPHEVLDRAAIAERFPQFAVPPHYVGLFEPRGGFLLVEQAVAAFVDRAMRAGAEIHGHEAVRDLAAGEDGVMVRTLLDDAG